MRILPLLLTSILLPQCSTQAADEWHFLNVPDAWRSMPRGEMAPVDGFSWYRATVLIPQSWKGEDLELYVEALDDARATFVNGNRVGATGTFPPRFRSGLGEKGVYRVSSDQVTAGEFTTLAIRVYQSDPRPNFSVAPPVLLNRKSSEAIRMDGTWQYRPGDDPKWAVATTADFDIDPARLPPAIDLRKKGGFLTVDKVTDIASYVRRRKGDNDPLTPQEAEQSFSVPDDLEIQLVLSEPDIAQPLYMTFDERGRLWVMEYRQYPDVAGVKMVSRDVYLRSVYDKVPEPPPHGAKGRDRISVHEDTDGDGVYDKHKVFVDGLNIATSVAPGRGGAFVTNPPYLLFYPDKDGDDIPDGDPEVLLEGFGLEDSHSVINSLRFGPDGWLYGAQGSTVTANVRKPGSKETLLRTMGQQIWRYHPELKKFEVFAEGGGNTFGVEIDEKGQVYSGHNGGDTRGFHYVQGGYYRKGFGKHGALSNPFAFGYFANMKHHSVPRFTHNFIIYEEGVLPSEYQGRLFGVEPLQGQVVMSEFQPYQSSFETKDISRVVKTDDQWFRPVDIKAGPDGCIYIADLYEQRIDHSSHYAGRIDRSSGRIYRLKPKNYQRPDVSVDPNKAVAALSSPLRSHRQVALRLIGDRHDASLIPRLTDQTLASTGQMALESLWALHLSGGLTDSTAARLLNHRDEWVRAWTVRLLCDHHSVSDDTATALQRAAAEESYIVVRKQLASSAARLKPEHALPIIRELTKYDEDAQDIHQPLLIWWALEAQATTDGRDQILPAILAEKEAWARPLVRQHLTERLMKRFALSGTRGELMAAAALLRNAPEKADTDLLLKGFEDAFKGRSLADIPQLLVDAISQTGGGSLALRLRQGGQPAIEEAMAAIRNSGTSSADRQQLVEILGEIRRSEFIPVLLELIKSEKDGALVAAALSSLQAYSDARIGEQITDQFGKLPENARLAAETLLTSRPTWAADLLAAVEKQQLDSASLSDGVPRRILLHNNSDLSARVQQIWGDVGVANAEKVQKELQRLNAILAEGSGNPKQGKPLYMKNCGRCHTLFKEGGQIGPDLTSFRRDNQERILINVVNPSLEIREGFENHVAITTDGRVLNGFLADRDNQVVVLRGIDGQNVVLRNDEVDDLVMSKVSIMPEGTLKTLTPQQIRDLFAYLRSSQPVNY